MTKLAELTTMKVGGEPKKIIQCHSRDELISNCRDVWQSGDDWLLLGGGSNVVVADQIAELTVIQVCNTGIEKKVGEGKQLWRIQAGENWDDLVASSVSDGLAGIEAMSGIPGSVGASPVQNIGAYGQELSDVFVRAEFLDYQTGEIQLLGPKDLAFGYRDSALKRGRLGVISWIEIELLDLQGESRPLYSSQIAGQLGLSMGQSAAVVDVRAAVLKLRASKGMLLDPTDPDSISCGSFFTNPIVTDSFARTLPSVAPRWESSDDDGLTVKLSAAWLIEQSGINKGFALAGSKAAISSKHALAITNRGGASATEVVELARFIQERVASQFGINLVPEPNLIGF